MGVFDEWQWKADYCKKHGLPAAQQWAWEIADRAFMARNIEQQHTTDTEEHMNEVYEICDCTGDDIYYPLGIFPDRKMALSIIEMADERKRKVSHMAENYEILRILKRTFGMTENGECIATIEREEYYDENDDEYYWRRCE